MKTRPPFAAFGWVVFLAWSQLLGIRPATAQHMFLDTNGDGTFTESDAYGFSSPATVDLYLVTDTNFDGSPAYCPEGGPLDVSSYTVNLRAFGEPVTFTNVTNHMAGMTPMIPLVTYPHALTVGYASFQHVPPGKHKLLSMTVTSEYGCPALAIVPSSCYSPPGIVTSFGSSCFGQQYDNTMRMGEEWFDGPWSGVCLHFRAPWATVLCPGEVVGVEGQTLTFSATVQAPNCGVEGFTNYGIPPGATIGPLSPFVAGEATQTVTWTPSRGQAGEYSVRFETFEYGDPYHGIPNHHATCETRIIVRAANSSPLADAGGPYVGVHGETVTFDGSDSSDPEGDSLEYSWDFGDGTNGLGPNPAHAYASGGTFTVVLTTTDPGGLSDQDSTTASIAHDLPVRVFATPSNQTTRVSRGKPNICFQIEAATGSPFTPDLVVPASVALRYTDPLCGERESFSVPTKSSGISDTDKNGISEYEACFSRGGIEVIASCLPEGRNSIRFELYGSLTNGDRFHGEIVHTVLSGSGSLHAFVSPNPLDAGSALEFRTATTGAVKAWLFDIRGRRVATLVDDPAVSAGDHRVPFQGFEGLRARLASGVYFVKIATQHDGSVTQRVTLLR